MNKIKSMVLLLPSYIILSGVSVLVQGQFGQMVGPILGESGVGLGHEGRVVLNECQDGLTTICNGVITDLGRSLSS